MAVRLVSLATLVGGQILGDGDVQVTGAAPEQPRARGAAPEPVGALVARGASGPA